MNRTSSDTACLAQQELEQLALGHIEEDRLEAVQSHLETCPHCLDRLERVTAHDSVTSAIHTAATVQQDLAALSDSIGRLLHKFEEQGTWRLLRSQSRLEAADGSVGGLFRGHEVFEPGHILANYVIEGFLGRGGMGVVYKARHLRMDRLVALKVLSSRGASESEAAARFQAEVKVLAKLNHPKIVTAHDAGESGGVHFLVMEYVDGRDLMSVVSESGPLPIKTAVDYISQAAQGLAYAHGQGVIHRDIKPANLLLDKTGGIKVLDLGLARLGDVVDARCIEVDVNAEHETSRESDVTTRDAVLGTIDFMAPEQAASATKADARADIYSLGSTLYYLLTGQTVLPRVRTQDKLAALREHSVTAVKSVRHEVPDQLDVVVQRMLATSVTDRFQSAGDVIAALAPFVEHESGATTSVETSRRSHGKLVVRLSCGCALLLLLACVAALLADPSRLAVDDSSSARPEITGESEVGVGHTANETVTTTPDHIPAAAPSFSQTDQQADRLIEALGGPNEPKDDVWRIFQAAADPTVRTQVINRLKPAGVSLTRLVDRLTEETDDGARAALLLAIGEFDPTEIAARQREDLADLLLGWYEHDSSSAVHSAITWLARRWSVRQVGALERKLTPESLYEAITELSPVLEQKSIPRQGGWYQTMQGQTMIVVKGPSTFKMGSPRDELDRVTGEPAQDESRRSVTIRRTFAIASTETTEEQFRLAHERYWEQPKADVPEEPKRRLSWDDAAWYCNRLSELEGMPPAEHCYELVPNPGPTGTYREKANALSLPGYRLPTEEEWEYACRGGTITSRYFGRDTDIAGKFASFVDTASQRVHPVGTLRPNDFGLFDTLGNVSEFAQDRVDSDTPRRRLRGGSVFTKLSGLRAAARYYSDQTFRNERVGFRVARTILPPMKTGDRMADVQIGPPARPQSSYLRVKSEREPSRTSQQFASFRWGDTVCLGTAWRGAIKPRRCRIVNLLDEPLHVTEAYLGGLFRIDVPQRTIPPRGEVQFQMAANDSGAGVRAGDLALRFEAGGTTSTHVGRVSGNVHGPVLDVLEARRIHSDDRDRVFDFGTVPLNSTASHVFSIYQPGDVELKISSVSVSEGFSLEPNWPSRIATLQFGHFRIRVDTKMAGLRTGRVRIVSSDGLQPDFEFAVKANVIESSRFSVAGVFRDGLWMFDRNRDGIVDEQIEFGGPGDRPVTGDVNGDGVCDIGVCRPLTDGTLQWQFLLRGVDKQLANEFTFSFGAADATPLLADVTGSGIDRPVAVAPGADGRHLVWRFDVDGDHRADLEYSRFFGPATAIPVVGDWNGDTVTDVGYVVRGDATNDFGYSWTLRRDADPGNDVTRRFGSLAQYPVVGDWDADGCDEIGYLRQRSGAEFADWFLDGGRFDCLPTVEFAFGKGGDLPVILNEKNVSKSRAD